MAKCAFYLLPDIRLMHGCQDGVDGDGDRGQVEVVKQHGQVVVEASRRVEVQVEHPTRHALYGGGGDGGRLRRRHGPSGVGAAHAV